jgi:hypothetical protein
LHLLAPAELTNMVEQPAEHADGASGWLAAHTKPGLTTADRYAWLTDAGPLSGRLNLEPDAGAACKLSVLTTVQVPRRSTSRGSQHDDKFTAAITVTKLMHCCLPVLGPLISVRGRPLQV